MIIFRQFRLHFPNAWVRLKTCDVSALKRILHVFLKFNYMISNIPPTACLLTQNLHRNIMLINRYGGFKLLLRNRNIYVIYCQSVAPLDEALTSHT